MHKQSILLAATMAGFAGVAEAQTRGDCTYFWAEETYTITYRQTSGPPADSPIVRSLTITNAYFDDGREELSGVETAGLSVSGWARGDEFFLKMSRSGQGDFTINGDCSSSTASGTGGYRDNAGAYRTYNIEIQ